jgi:hypothetical protein
LQKYLERFVMPGIWMVGDAHPTFSLFTIHYSLTHG